MIYFLSFFFVFSLATSYLIETSSWYLRVHSLPNNIGHFISKSNILLYLGRFFAILSQLLVSLFIDNGVGTAFVITIYFSASIFSVAVHYIIFFNLTVRNKLISVLLFILRLPKNSLIDATLVATNDKKLILATTIVTSIFVLGMTLPMVLASMYPDLRLTMSNLGSGVNFFGMLLLLSYLDPILYRELDRGHLVLKIDSYISGKIIAYIVSSSLLGLFLLTMQKF